MLAPDRCALARRTVMTAAALLALLTICAPLARAEWDSDLSSPGPAIEGYSSEVSVRPGQTFHLHVSTAPAQSYRVEISRLGWYTGVSPPVLACVPSCTGSKPGFQRPVPPPDALGKVDAGWPETDSFKVPKDWQSGVYGARVVLTSGPSAGRGRVVPIVVREPAGQHSAILVQASVSTWQAYNSWGGRNLYDTAGIPRAHAVSFNRPYYAFFTGGQSYFDWEIQLARFLEREGYDVSYTTDVDVARDPSSLLGHKLVVTSGHDEYWNTSQRNAFEAARDANPPVNLAFFSANTSYWHIRYADDFRTEIAYKDANLDPEPNPAEKTVLFRDLSPPRRECELMGVQDQNALISGTVDYSVAGTNLGDPWFTNTGLKAGDAIRKVVGYEFDGIQPGCKIAGSEATPLTQFFHYQAGPGSPPADATRYTAPSGARVFASGTFSLSWALDGFGTHGNYVNPGVQEFARHLFDDMSGRTVLPSSVVDGALAKSLRAFRPTHIGTLRSTGLASQSFSAPGPGEISVKWLAGSAKVARGFLAITSAGRVDVVVSLTSTGKKLLRHAKRLKILVSATYTPSRAKPHVKTRRLTLTR